jgi:cytochrome c oxidase subunit 2
MDGIINFHHDLFFFLVTVLIFVLRIYSRTLSVFSFTSIADSFKKQPKVQEKSSPARNRIEKIVQNSFMFTVVKKWRRYRLRKAPKYRMYDFEARRKPDVPIITKEDAYIVRYGKNNKKVDTNKLYHVVHAPTLEIIWTVIPAFILILISIPSFSLLYTIDEVTDPLLTVKIIGHQWYWNYEFISPLEWLIDDTGEAIVSNFAFDSYMVAPEDLKEGELRLLEVDNRLYLPTEINIRLSITSGDVLHSWAVPSLGIKVDSCPGRINQTNLFIKRPATFYGQCSELCGINHGFMPIVVQAQDLCIGFSPSAPVVHAAYPLFMNVYYQHLLED